MTLSGWAQIALVLGLVALTAVPLGAFMARLFTGGRTFLHPLLGPIETLFYRLAGVSPARGQGWLQYATAMLLFNGAGFLTLYLLLRHQDLLPLNPQGVAGLAPDLAFNTAISFVTNTNWQSYAGETTMSHLSQMAGLAVQNFLSAATGIALAIAVTRAFTQSSLRELGNFWVDLTRTTLYVLLPLAIVIALALCALGVPQTLEAHMTAATLDGARQAIALGPVASQEAIKQLGTNGGGFFNANSAHPFENPSAWTNIIEIWAMIALPFALTVTFGRMVGDRRQGWALFAVMAILLTVSTAAIYAAESAGNPILSTLGVDGAGGNMEGKEVRFGTAMTALWAAATTGASCGAVNGMHASLTPLGGLVPMLLMQLGEILPGGVGSGLYGIVVIAILAVFIAGLMVGRTPEYIGKKIHAHEVKMAMLALLILPLSILGFSAVSAVVEAGRAGVLNAGPHGLSEILYAFSSATGNNGSAFAGLSANSPWYNVTLGIAMLLGRFGYVVPVMALAGSLAAKLKTPESAGTFPTHGGLFIGLVIGVILIVGGLEFFPALALGPIVEHVLMNAGQLF